MPWSAAEEPPELRRREQPHSGHHRPIYRLLHIVHRGEPAVVLVVDVRTFEGGYLLVTGTNAETVEWCGAFGGGGPLKRSPQIRQDCPAAATVVDCFEQSL